MSTVIAPRPTAADPAYRRARAKKAAQRRHSLDTYIRSIVDRAPELTAEQRDRLAAILRSRHASDDLPEAS
jgi:hypothetical protein